VESNTNRTWSTASMTSNCAAPSWCTMPKTHTSWGQEVGRHPKR
jgi:hypothetical protein